MRGDGGGGGREASTPELGGCMGDARGLFACGSASRQRSTLSRCDLAIDRRQPAVEPPSPRCSAPPPPWMAHPPRDPRPPATPASSAASDRAQRTAATMAAGLVADATADAAPPPRRASRGQPPPRRAAVSDDRRRHSVTGGRGRTGTARAARRPWGAFGGSLAVGAGAGRRRGGIPPPPPPQYRPHPDEGRRSGGTPVPSCEHAGPPLRQSPRGAPPRELPWRPPPPPR